MRALTFLVISCPCALVISIPLTFFGGIGGASKCGILVKGGNYLEALSKTSIAVFDKTGTLTKGVFKVTRVIPSTAGLRPADDGVRRPGRERLQPIPSPKASSGPAPTWTPAA